jgi:hypothetical protein
MELKMIILLSIACILIWTVGAILTTLLTGWELNKITDFFKIVFWFVSIFFKR